MTQRGKQTLREAYMLLLQLPRLYPYHTQVCLTHMKQRCEAQKVRTSSEGSLFIFFFYCSGEKLLQLAFGPVLSRIFWEKYVIGNAHFRPEFQVGKL